MFHRALNLAQSAYNIRAIPLPHTDELFIQSRPLQMYRLRRSYPFAESAYVFDGSLPGMPGQISRLLARRL